MSAASSNIVAVLLVVSIAAFVAGVPTASQCHARFDGRCTCGPGLYDKREQYIVNCTNAGFRTADMLAFLPAQTEVLLFTGNRIEELPPNVFGTANNYERLRTVDLSNNHLREIRGKAFHHVSSVELLILNHNNLSIAPPDDSRWPSATADDGEANHHHPRVFSNFVNLKSLHLTNAFADNTSDELSIDLHDIFVSSNLTKLQKLHLEQNEIRHFSDRNVFCNLPALRDLYLEDNQLTGIAFNVSCVRGLKFLNLEGNRFELVQERDLRLLDRFQAQPGHDPVIPLMVDWTKNPFVCDCKLRPFIDWMKATKVVLQNAQHIQCRVASGGALENVLDFETPKCQLFGAATTHGGTGHVIVMAMLLGAFSALLCVMVVAIVYMSRERIRRSCAPMLSAVSKKVQYTTIRNEDASPAEVNV